jgi:hypothetical protein
VIEWIAFGQLTICKAFLRNVSLPSSVWKDSESYEERHQLIVTANAVSTSLVLVILKMEATRYSETSYRSQTAARLRRRLSALKSCLFVTI